MRTKKVKAECGDVVQLRMHGEDGFAGLQIVSAEGGQVVGETVLRVRQARAVAAWLNEWADGQESYDVMMGIGPKRRPTRKGRAR